MQASNPTFLVACLLMNNINEPLLKLNLSVSEYLEILNRPVSVETTGQKKFSLPLYRIAECPICSSETSAHLDTYSVRGWPFLTVAGIMGHVITKCEHFVTSQFFINLNGLLPTDVKYFRNGCEIPYVIKPALIGESGKEPLPQNTYAVIHALPVCRIESNQFVPRYVVYMITYFADRARAIWESLVHSSSEGAPLVPQGSTQDKALWWNLSYWVEQGKLLWLDPSQPEQPLQRASDSFPYAKIVGQPRPITYRMGKVSERSELLPGASERGR